MTGKHRNPAIYAGLAGSFALAAPTQAQALTLFGQEVSAASMGVPFVAGCVVGALVASGTMLAADHVAEVRSERRRAEQALDEHARRHAAPTSSARAAQQPTGRIARAQRQRHSTAESWEQTGNIRVQQPQEAASPVSGAAAAYGAAPRRAAATSAQATDHEPMASRIPQIDDPFDGMSAVYGAQAGASVSGAASPSGVAGRSSASPSASTPGREAGYQQDARGGQPAAQVGYQPAARVGAYQPSGSNDYVEVAENYVRQRTMAQRMATRAKGVASVLSERLGASRMEGLPVIERADGTVGDVGESWWDSAFDESQKTGSMQRPLSDLVGIDEQIAGNSAVMFTAQTAAEAQAAYEVLRNRGNQASRASYEDVAAQQGRQPEAAYQAAAWQGRQVPTQPVEPYQPEVPYQPDLAQQPAWQAQSGQNGAAADAGQAEDEAGGPRWTDTQQDLWAVALAALDERFDEEVAMGPSLEPEPVFDMPQILDDEDDGAGSLDEPEGLEASTQFIPFRPQAGHPEVVDTEGYIDLIVDQEISRSNNPSVRKGYRDYLRIIDGGTNRLPRSARHMAAQA